MWQTIITGIIIAAVFIYVVAKIIRIFIHPEKVKCNCGCKGCPFLKENSCCSKPSQEKEEDRNEIIVHETIIPPLAPNLRRKKRKTGRVRPKQIDS